MFKLLTFMTHVLNHGILTIRSHFGHEKIDKILEK